MRRALWLGVLSGILVVGAGCGESECTGFQLRVDGECGGIFDDGRDDVDSFSEDATAPPRSIRSGLRVASHTTGHSIAVRGSEIYALDRDNSALVVLDTASGGVLRRVALGEKPYNMVMSPGGAIFVTERYEGTVSRIEPEGDKVETRTGVGGGPTGIALSRDAETLFVSLTELDVVVALDPVTLEETGRTEVARPRAVVSVSDDEIAVTSEHPWVSHIKFTRGARTVFDLERHTALRENNPLELDNSFSMRTGRQNRAFSAALHPETGAVLVAHQLAFPGSDDTSVVVKPPAADTSYGGGGGGGGRSISVGRPVETTVTVAGDVNGMPGLRAPLTDDVARVSMPNDIVHHPTHTIALIAGGGTNNVLLVNTRLADPMSAPIGVVSVGKAPRGIAITEDGLKAFVLNGHDFTISEIDLRPFVNASDEGDTWRFNPSFFTIKQRHERDFAFGVDPLPITARIGRDIFTQNNFKGLSHQGNFSCESCHPEGTEDRAVWFGAIGPRQTPSLAGRLKNTEPFNWVGSEATLADNFVRTVQRMGGSGLTEPELQSLENFVLDGLSTPPNPHASGELTEQQAYGQALFYNPQVGCGDCHSGPGLTDGKAHDVGTVSIMEMSLVEDGLLEPEQLGVYDTPSLKDLFRTAPYLHDGSAPTLMDVLDRTATTMGYTEHLSFEQKEALIAFMLTL